MIFNKFSPKQVKSMLWWKFPEISKRDALICDGSVRSGKSLSMTIGFILWSCSEFNGQAFAICGKTAGSIRRNVILPMQQWLEGVAKISLKLSRSCFDVTINGNTNRYYYFGGKDESSSSLIQGMTLAGVMFDEVALMPKSFVEQALARCSVKGSRFWFNCNPDSPQHWFYREWIQKLNKRMQLICILRWTTTILLIRQLKNVMKICIQAFSMNGIFSDYGCLPRDLFIRTGTINL